MSNKISKAARKLTSDEGLLAKIDELTDEDIAQLSDYCQSLYRPTEFDQEVEREPEKLDAKEQRRLNAGRIKGA